MTVKQLRHHRTKRQNLIKRMDALMSEIVIMRDRACVTCGSKYNLCCGHLITRGDLSVRYSFKNCNASCGACNSIHEVNNKPYRSWFIKKYGNEALEELEAQANQDVKPIKVWQLKLTEEQLKVVKKGLEDQDCINPGHYGGLVDLTVKQFPIDD